VTVPPVTGVLYPRSEQCLTLSANHSVVHSRGPESLLYGEPEAIKQLIRIGEILRQFT